MAFRLAFASLCLLLAIIVTPSVNEKSVGEIVPLKSAASGVGTVKNPVIWH